MSDTPRTDAFAKALAEKMEKGYDDEWYDWRAFAYELELELECAHQSELEARNLLAASKAADRAQLERELNHAKEVLDIVSRQLSKVREAIE